MTEKKRTPFEVIRNTFLQKDVQHIWRILLLQGTRFAIAALIAYVAKQGWDTLRKKK